MCDRSQEGMSLRKDSRKKSKLACGQDPMFSPCFRFSKSREHRGSYFLVPNVFKLDTFVKLGSS